MLLRFVTEILPALGTAIATSGLVQSVSGGPPRPAQIRSSRLRVEILTDPLAFDLLTDAWNELLDDSEQRAFFLRPDWCRRWWQHQAPPDGALRIVACRDMDGRLLGLAPLYARRRLIWGIPGLRELLLLGTGTELKTSEHLDVITRRHHEAEVAHAIAECLRQRADWDRIWLWQVPRESSALPHFLSEFPQGVRTAVCDQAPYIDTACDWANLKCRYGRSMRRNVEYYPRRLFAAHQCEFRRVIDLAEAARAMDALVQLHQARWEQKGEPGAFGKGSESLLRDAVADGLYRGRIRLWTLDVDGRTEAVLLGFLDGGVLHYFQKGFNPAFLKQDLGTVIVALAIRACTADPEVRAFDFMGGGAPYKDMWARLIRTHLVAEVVRKSWRTHLFDAQTSLGNVGTSVYRAIVPMRLRLARKEWLRQLRLVRAQRTRSSVFRAHKGAT